MKKVCVKDTCKKRRECEHFVTYKQLKDQTSQVCVDPLLGVPCFEKEDLIQKYDLLSAIMFASKHGLDKENVLNDCLSRTIDRELEEHRVINKIKLTDQEKEVYKVVKETIG